MDERYEPDIRKKIELTNPEQLYQIKDENGQIIDFEEANGRQIFNHYRHNLTNYDEVLNDTRKEQGYVTGRQEKKAAIGAAEKVLEEYRNEHIKVIKEAQKKRAILNKLMQKAGVGTAIALVNLLDSWSDKIKKVSKLENSQRTLQTWNDTYRVQRQLVKKLLTEENVSQEVVDKVNLIYGTRSVNKAIDVSLNLFDLERSEIIKLVKSAIRYAKL